jgi:hypothetical protein
MPMVRGTTLWSLVNDYRLREGVSEQRLGMTLLRQQGVLDRLERSTKPEKVPGTEPETDNPR